jgi:hypothetical protein
MVKSYKYIPKIKDGHFICGNCGEFIYFPYMVCELGCKKKINWQPLAKNWEYDGEPQAFRFKYEHFIKGSIVECVNSYGIACGYLQIGARYKVVSLFYDARSTNWEAWTLNLITLDAIYDGTDRYGADFFHEIGKKCDFPARHFQLVDLEKEKQSEEEDLIKLREDIKKSIWLKEINKRIKTNNQRVRYLLEIIKKEVQQSNY